MSMPELSRPVRADTIGVIAMVLEIEASEGERAALARRFGLVALDRLVATVSLMRAQEDIMLTGQVQADLAQSCVASAETVPGRIDEPFAIRFRAPPAAGDEEIELDAEEMDVMFIEGAMVDVGEAVAQTLALALDSYPRAPDAEATLRASGVKSAEEAGPFGALAALKDKLQ